MSPVGVGVFTGAQLDDRKHRLAHLGVGNADDGNVGDLRVLHQDALDLGGVDVGAAGDDQVGAAVGDEEIPIGVEVAEVAGGEEAVAEGVAVLVVGVAVAESQVGAFT